MNSPVITPPTLTSVDEDVAKQARPGHGIPSQDPNPTAQFAQEPAAVQSEVKSALVGGGVVGGAVTGATIGVAVRPGRRSGRSRGGCRCRRTGWRCRGDRGEQ